MKKSVNEKLTLLYKECFKKDLKEKKIQPKTFEKEVYQKFATFIKKKDLKIKKNLEEKEKTILDETKIINYSKTLKKKIEYTGNMDFLERMKYYQKNKKKQIKKMRLKKKREENKELKKLYTFRPKINNKKLKKKRTVDDLLNWGIKKEKNIIKKRNKIYKNTNNKKKLLVRSVHVKNRFYLIRNNLQKNFSSNSHKDVSERLYDYRVFYRNRKNEKIKLLTKNLFKPRLISQEKNIKKSGTKKIIKKHLERNFIDYNKKTKSSKKVNQLTQNIKRTFLKDKKPKIKKIKTRKKTNEENEILNGFKNLEKLEDLNNKTEILFDTDQSSSMFNENDNSEMKKSNITLKKSSLIKTQKKDFEKLIDLDIKDNYSYVNLKKKMSLKKRKSTLKQEIKKVKKISLKPEEKKKSIILEKKKSIKPEKKKSITVEKKISIKPEKKKSIKLEKKKSITVEKKIRIKPEKKKSIKLEKKEIQKKSIIKKSSLKKKEIKKKSIRKKSTLKPERKESEKLPLRKSNSKFKRKKKSLERIRPNYSFNENLLKNLKNSGIGQFTKNSIPDVPLIEEDELIEINKILSPQKILENKINLIFEEKKKSIEKIPFLVKREDKEKIKLNLEKDTKLNSIPIFPNLEKKDIIEIEKVLSLNSYSDKEILSKKNLENIFNDKTELERKSIFDQEGINEELVKEENSVSEKLPYNSNEVFIEKHQTLANSIF